MHPRKDEVLLSSWSGFSVCSSDPRSLQFAQANANAAGDAHVAIELTVDGDLAQRGATLDVADILVHGPPATSHALLPPTTVGHRKS